MPGAARRPRSARPAFAAYPGANGKIAYERDDGIDSEIYVMNADGSGQTNLINDPDPPNHADDRDPSWSPDGTKIAFARVAEGHMNIFVMNADGSGRVNLTPGPDTTGQANAGVEPTWSPDGTKIAYNYSGAIWIMNASGANKVRLVPIPETRDRARVVTRRIGDRVHPLCRIWSRPSAGGGGTNITNNGATGPNAERSPDWSPNSSQIVYQRAGQIWSMNAGGSGQTALTGGINETGQLPAWSPDGTKIVFDSNGFTAPNGYDIFVMNADGTNGRGSTPALTPTSTRAGSRPACPGGTPARGAPHRCACRSCPPTVNALPPTAPMDRPSHSVPAIRRRSRRASSRWEHPTRTARQRTRVALPRTRWSRVRPAAATTPT